MKHWLTSDISSVLPVRIFLACVGGGAVQGSIRWWSSKHRAHHRWTDTVKDPYSVMKGLWYSHFMWMVLNQNPKNKGRTDISDLNEDPVVVWQHKHYGSVILVFGMLFPMLVAGLGWGDWKGGLVYAGILRFSFVQQATFCVNSLAHWLGEQVSHCPYPVLVIFPFALTRFSHSMTGTPLAITSLPHWSLSAKVTTTSTTR